MIDKVVPKVSGWRGPRVLAVANQKGGVGKTTTAVNLATAMAACDMKVLIVDLDPQGNASTGLGIPRTARDWDSYAVLTGAASMAEATEESTVPNLWIVPSSAHLSGAEIELVSVDEREYRLREAMVRLPVARIELHSSLCVLDREPRVLHLQVTRSAVGEQTC